MQPLRTVRVRLSARHDLQAYCAKVKPPIRKRPRQPRPLRRVKRGYRLEHHALVVYLRHRSLMDYSRVWYRWCEIVKLTGVKESTCRGMVQRFQQKGLSTVKSTRQPRPLPADVRQYLLDNLQQHRFLSLRRRCELLRLHCDFHILPKRLQRCYRRMGVVYGPCKTVMKAALRSLPSRQAERLEFVEKVVSLLVQGKHVIFADETSVNLWDRKRLRKTWQLEGEPVRHLVNT